MIGTNIGVCEILLSAEFLLSRSAEVPFKDCPRCGKGVRQIDPKCWNCNYDFRKGKPKVGRIDASQEAVHCPNCWSTSIHAEKRGWKWTTGFIGSGKIIVTCLSCGHKFKPGRGG
jgi:hypothetical protein